MSDEIDIGRKIIKKHSELMEKLADTPKLAAREWSLIYCVAPNDPTVLKTLVAFEHCGQEHGMRVIEKSAYDELMAKAEKHFEAELFYQREWESACERWNYSQEENKELKAELEYATTCTVNAEARLHLTLDELTALKKDHEQEQDWKRIQDAERECERLKEALSYLPKVPTEPYEKTMAKELHKLQAQLQVAREALEQVKSGGGRAEILGLDKSRCPQCASAEIANEALAKTDMGEIVK